MRGLRRFIGSFTAVDQVMVQFRDLSLLTKLDVEPSTALLAITRVCELDSDAVDGHDWFPYAYGRGAIINICESAIMSLHIENCSKEPAGAGEI